MGLPKAVSWSLSADAQSTPVSVPKAGTPALTRRFTAPMADHWKNRLGRPTSNGGPFIITPVGTPSSFIDHLQQVELRPEGLNTQTLVHQMPLNDHTALQVPGRNVLPAELASAGLVALSRHPIFRCTQKK